MKYVQGLSTALPTVLGQEAQFRPQFGALNLGDIGQFLGGSGSQQGIYGMGAEATAQSGQQLQDARIQQYEDMLGNTGMVRRIFGGISPGSESLMNNQTMLANNAYTRAQGPLSFQEQRGADQQAREAFASRGRLNDNASVSAEILGREDVRTARRAEAAQMGGQAFGMEQQYSSPAMGLLSGSPASVLLGQDYLNSGKQAIGTAVPQLIDTGAGISLGQQQASNLANWQSNVSSAKNAQSAQNVQTGAAVASAALGALAAFSDRRVKSNVRKVGKTDDGLPIYVYNLMNSGKTEMGVMAQEVKKKKPSALGPVIDGLMTVDYAKVS